MVSIGVGGYGAVDINVPANTIWRRDFRWEMHLGVIARRRPRPFEKLLELPIPLYRRNRQLVYTRIGRP